MVFLDKHNDYLFMCLSMCVFKNDKSKCVLQQKKIPRIFSIIPFQQPQTCTLWGDFIKFVSIYLKPQFLDEQPGLKIDFECVCVFFNLS